MQSSVAIFSMCVVCVCFIRGSGTKSAIDEGCIAYECGCCVVFYMSITYLYISYIFVFFCAVNDEHLVCDTKTNTIINQRFVCCVGLG